MPDNKKYKHGPAAPAVCIAVATALLAPLLATAQPAPTAPLVTPRDLRPETPPATPAPLPQAAPATAPAGSDQLFVTLRDVRVNDGYPEFATATQAIVAPLAGRRTAVAEFYRAAEAIESLYRAAGYPLVRVVVPPQSVRDDETLVLTVLDGFVEHVDVEAVAPRARAQVAAAMRRLVGQRRLTNRELERVLTLAGRSPGIGLRSTLAQGTTAGGVILVLDGSFDPFAGSAAVDNRSSKALGQWQATVQMRANQVLGLGEQAYVYISGDARPGRTFDSGAPRRVAGGGVSLPVGSDGWILNPELTWSDTFSAATALTPRIESKFQRFTLRATYPVVLSREEELSITGAFEAGHQRNSAPDFGTLLQEDRLRVLRLGADWARPAPWEAARLRLTTTLSKGLSGLGARTPADAASSGIALSRPGSRPDFAKVEAGIALDQALPGGAQSRTLVRLQKARDVLPSAELFGLEGEDALSTFRSGSLSDDSGWLVRQEFARPFTLQAGGAPLALLPYVFLAAGRGHAEGPVLGASRGLSASWGLGLRAGWQLLNLSLEYGRRKSEPADLDGTQFFLKAQVQF
jgi:hemolysin activation/secretion protein